MKGQKDYQSLATEMVRIMIRTMVRISRGKKCIVILSEAKNPEILHCVQDDSREVEPAGQARNSRKRELFRH